MKGKAWNPGWLWARLGGPPARRVQPYRVAVFSLSGILVVLSGGLMNRTLQPPVASDFVAAGLETAAAPGNAAVLAAAASPDRSPVPVPAGVTGLLPDPETTAEDAPVTVGGQMKKAIQDLGKGTASYYADFFHGRRTASGERYRKDALTAAHRSLPFGSRVRVTNPANGRSVVVVINDRGPYHGKRVIDLSRAAAEALGMVRRGLASVQLELLPPAP